MKRTYFKKVQAYTSIASTHKIDSDGNICTIKGSSFIKGVDDTKLFGWL